MRNNDCWDEFKNTGNMLEHGIDFIDTLAMFEEGTHDVRWDDAHSSPDEDRFITLDYTPKLGGITVVYVESPDHHITIISAWRTKE